MTISKVDPYIYYNSTPVKFKGSEQPNFMNRIFSPETSDSFEYSKSPSKLTGTKVSKEEIEKEVQAIIDSGCKMYNIPEELKPSLVVVDSIQYAPTEEITQKFREALPDKDIDLDIFSSSKKHPKDMSRNEFISFIARQTDTPKKEIEKIIKTGNGKDKGFYSSYDNTITYYTDGYREGSETIEETILHELYHAREAIVRSALPQEDRDDIVKDELITRLTQKESRNVFKQYPSDDNMASAMMTVPIFDDTTRVALTNFAINNLFTNDLSLHEKMQKYSELLGQEKPDETELAKAKADLNGLAEQIENISSKSKVFKENPTIPQMIFGLSKKEKNKLLFDYMMSIEFRYQYYREKEIKNVPTTKKSKEYRNIAKKSINDHISSTQATYAMNIARQQKKRTGDALYWDYYTSREEVGARIESERKEVTILKQKLANSIGNTPKDELKMIKKILKIKESKYREDLVYYKFFEAEDKLKENPKDFKNRVNYVLSSYMVTFLRNTRHTSTNKKLAYALATGTFILASCINRRRSMNNIYKYSSNLVPNHTKNIGIKNLINNISYIGLTTMPIYPIKDNIFKTLK